MVMVAHLAATEAVEGRFGHVRAGAVRAVGLLMVDALHLKAGMARIPKLRLAILGGPVWLTHWLVASAKP